MQIGAIIGPNFNFMRVSNYLNQICVVKLAQIL